MNEQVFKSQTNQTSQLLVNLLAEVLDNGSSAAQKSKFKEIKEKLEQGLNQVNSIPYSYSKGKHPLIKDGEEGLVLDDITSKIMDNIEALQTTGIVKAREVEQEGEKAYEIAVTFNDVSTRIDYTVLENGAIVANSMINTYPNERMVKTNATVGILAKPTTEGQFEILDANITLATVNDPEGDQVIALDAANAGEILGAGVQANIDSAIDMLSESVVRAAEHNAAQQETQNDKIEDAVIVEEAPAPKAPAKAKAKGKATAKAKQRTASKK